MMGLHHFFDNRLGGSLHGESQTGLTPFGELAVRNMQKKGIMIDVAHSSEATVRDTLRVTEGDALIVSHTGFDGHCPSPRNISDETIALITEAGGLIGVGFWADVTCGEGIDAIASAIQYGVERFGVDHIALGSDWDGSVTTPIDASQLPPFDSGVAGCRIDADRGARRDGRQHGALFGATPATWLTTRGCGGVSSPNYRVAATPSACDGESRPRTSAAPTGRGE